MSWRLVVEFKYQLSRAYPGLFAKMNFRAQMPLQFIERFADVWIYHRLCCAFALRARREPSRSIWAHREASRAARFA